MIKKTINYEDFDGQQVTEDHYFHLSKRELIQMETGAEGGSLVAKFEKVIKDGAGSHLIKTFCDIIAAAYGQRDPADPRKFVKTDKLREDFMGSLAFDQLLSDLMTDENAAADFVNGVMPSDLVEKANALAAGGQKTETVNPNSHEPSMTDAEADKASGLRNPRFPNGNLLPWAFRHPTPKEQMTMEKAQLIDCMQRQQSGWDPSASVTG